MKNVILIALVASLLVGCEQKGTEADVDLRARAERAALKGQEAATRAAANPEPVIVKGPSAQVSEAVTIYTVKVRGCWYVVADHFHAGYGGVAITSMNEPREVASTKNRGSYAPEQQVCD